MKYLKSFNEDLINREELKDFCEMYLAYLIDDNIKISVIQNTIHPQKGSIERDSINIIIQGFMSYENNKAIFKTWGEIKNHFIPFIQMLDNNYNIDNDKSISFPNAVDYRIFTKDEIINDIRSFSSSGSSIKQKAHRYIIIF